MTYMQWRRHFAHSEARALRCLIRTHGHLPEFAPTRVTIADWHHHCRGVATQGRAA